MYIIVASEGLLSQLFCLAKFADDEDEEDEDDEDNLDKKNDVKQTKNDLAIDMPDDVNEPAQPKGRRKIEMLQ